MTDRKVIGSLEQLQNGGLDETLLKDHLIGTVTVVGKVSTQVINRISLQLGVMLAPHATAENKITTISAFGASFDLQRQMLVSDGSTVTKQQLEEALKSHGFEIMLEN